VEHTVQEVISCLKQPVVNSSVNEPLNFLKFISVCKRFIKIAKADERKSRMHGLSWHSLKSNIKEQINTIFYIQGLNTVQY
jgi:hypothetical protein